MGEHEFIREVFPNADGGRTVFMLTRYAVLSRAIGMIAGEYEFDSDPTEAARERLVVRRGLRRLIAECGPGRAGCSTHENRKGAGPMARADNTRATKITNAAEAHGAFKALEYDLMGETSKLLAETKALARVMGDAPVVLALRELRAHLRRETAELLLALEVWLSEERDKATA
jgi:hypothetical protein